MPIAARKDSRRGPGRAALGLAVAEAYARGGPTAARPCHVIRHRTGGHTVRRSRNGFGGQKEAHRSAARRRAGSRSSGVAEVHFLQVGQLAQFRGQHGQLVPPKSKLRRCVRRPSRAVGSSCHCHPDPRLASGSSPPARAVSPGRPV